MLLLPMASRILFDASFLVLSFDYTHNWLYADWRGPQTLETVQAGSAQLVEQLRRERCDKLLNDNRAVHGMWMDGSEWISRDLPPELAAAGLRYVAWVYSPEVFSRLSAQRVVEQASRRFLTFAFEDAAAARAWLSSM
ncbi:hypothetical protein KLP40_08765 [Hymenobacter sp. NST-14]|uniref:hypothetical protein n=1 Tax=Hymenobacter piscis TaxID=2839984 RepID=UPI001C029287|nr:hypothetical protein [Hymenobacter piscis]MBT9393253.1 hypothetical protein [Hymenobacter piscis]